MAIILAKKCSGKLYEVTEYLRRPVFEEEKVEELYGEILMSAKTPKKEGKGYEYPTIWMEKSREKGSGYFIW